MVLAFFFFFLFFFAEFRVNWPFSSGEQGQNIFLRWRQGQSTSCSDTSYQVLSRLAFRFRRKSTNRFSRRRQWRPSWISDRNDLAIFIHFLSKSHPDDSYQVSSQLAHGCRRSRLLKQIVDDGRRTMTDHNHFVLK